MLMIFSLCLPNLVSFIYRILMKTKMNCFLMQW